MYESTKVRKYFRTKIEYFRTVHVRVHVYSHNVHVPSCGSTKIDLFISENMGTCTVQYVYVYSTHRIIILYLFYIY